MLIQNPYDTLPEWHLNASRGPFQDWKDQAFSGELQMKLWKEKLPTALINDVELCWPWNVS